MSGGGLRRGREVRPACWAPFSSLHLDPRGVVRACCQNTWHHLGDVATTSLLDIWRGEAAEELRRRLARQDLSLGCELCAVEAGIGADASSYRHQFDDLAPVPGDAWPRQLELALSASCNLQCVMCNGELSSSIRIHREGRPALPTVYGERFFAELDEFLPHLERVTFLGGEPFLGAEPLRVMDRLIARGLTPTCHVNTNGTQWSERVRRVFRSLPLHVAVSVDGATDATIEAVRVGVDAARLRRTVDEMREVCRAEGHGFSLTFCLMVDTWTELLDVLAWGDALDCDVFTNTVTNPPRFSLHHLPAGEVAAVAAGLDARDGEARSRLGRNLPTWERALGQVRALAATRAADPPVGHAAATVARRAAEAVAGPDGVVTVHVRDDLMISAIEPDPRDVLGVDLAHLVGDHSIELMTALGPRLGTLVGTDLELAAGGVELRRFTYDGPGGRRVLLAAMAPRPGGETWSVALGPPAAAHGRPVRIGRTRRTRPSG